MYAKLRTLRSSSALLGITLLLPPVTFAAMGLAAQAQTASVSQIGTVKAIAGNTVTLTTDKGQQVAVTVADGARILQLTPGSKDLKSAQVIALTDVAAGDRILVTGKAGDAADSLTASRVILMKSTDIAEQHAAEAADWQKRGSGGIVSALNPANGSITLASGAKKINVVTSGSTIFRRYAGDSVKFEDAKPSTLAQIQVGDQMRVRGAKSADGDSIQAQEIVSGSFENLSGLLASVDAATGTITLKDLATKKMKTVKITSNSDLRRLPERAAAMFAARARGGAAGAPASAPAASATPGERPGGPGRSASMDLSQMLSRLPNETAADLKVGEAVMIVASQPILAATPSGSAGLTLSPWSVGGEAPDGGAN
jgi:co-chaperonin GroES (HSP10)